MSSYDGERGFGFIVMLCLVWHGLTVLCNLKSFEMSDFANPTGRYLRRSEYVGIQTWSLRDIGHIHSVQSVILSAIKDKAIVSSTPSPQAI